MMILTGLPIEHLHSGETANSLTCPTCNGGANSDKSFSVTRVEGGFVYICFRAGCGARGYEKAPVQLSGEPPSGGRGHQARPFDRPTIEIPPEVQDFVRSRYSITHSTLARFGVRWAPPQADRDRGPRLIMPILRPDGSEAGVCARSLGGEQPKVLIHLHGDRPCPMSYFPPQTTGGNGTGATAKGVLFVVEDHLSAMRLWQTGRGTGVSLSGTNINHARATELGVIANGCPVYLMLDRDATNKSVKYASVFRYAADFRVVALGKDIKDQSEDELNLTLEGVV